MILDGLNEAQRQVVTSEGGPHVVVAGAGTGKTRTLVARVAWLLDRGVSPASIVLLTFTRRAAREMLDRVAEHVGPAARGVRGGTFHGFAVELVRRYAERLGYTRNVTVMDRSDAEQLVGMVRAELGLGERNRRFPRKGTILSVLSKAVNTGRSVAAVLAEDWPQYEADAADITAVGERYAERKRARDLVDYDDLLVLLARLLSRDDEVRREVSQGCQHVLVDEFQDTNRVQGLIAGLLASEHGNLMVVGDEAQSIYAFRGAAVENILDFPRLYPDATVTLLEQNYRSTPQILDLANGVLESAAQGYGKRLWSEVAPGDPPELVEPVDEAAQTDAVVAEVLRLREAGVGIDRQAVLFRAASHANVLEVALAAAGIPFRKYGGIRFTEAAHVKDVLALLRLVANPRDVLSWVRVLSWCEGIGEKRAEALAEAIAGAAEPALDPEPYRRKKAFVDLVALRRMLADADARRHDVPGLVAGLVDGYGAWMERLYDDAHRRRKDLESLQTLADGHDALELLLAELALEPPEAGGAPGAADEEGALTLTTVHSAKGLEWDTVHLIQLGNGAFPSGWSLDDPAALEEERRLLYVAVTRARRRLRLLQPRWMDGRAAAMAGPGCLLLEAIPGLDGRVRRVRPGRAVAATAASAGDGRAEERVARLLGWFER